MCMLFESQAKKPRSVLCFMSRWSDWTYHYRTSKPAFFVGIKSPRIYRYCYQIILEFAWTKHWSIGGWQDIHKLYTHIAVIYWYVILKVFLAEYSSSLRISMPEARLVPARKKVKLAPVRHQMRWSALEDWESDGRCDPAWPGLSAQRPRQWPDPLSNMETRDFKCIFLDLNFKSIMLVDNSCLFWLVVQCSIAYLKGFCNVVSHSGWDRSPNVFHQIKYFHCSVTLKSQMFQILSFSSKISN